MASVCNSLSSGGSGNRQVYDIHELTAIINQLIYEFENHKYTVYRCAAKFATLQKMFFTSYIPYKLVLVVMERNGICDDDLNLMVPPFQLTSLMHDVFFACEKMGYFSNLESYSLESATATLCSFFWNVFDPHRQHSVSQLEIKVTFLLLCKLYASDQMVPEYYNLLSHTKTKCVSKLNFEHMLNILAKIFSYIGEGVAYGPQNVQLVMDQCYTKDISTKKMSHYFSKLCTALFCFSESINEEESNIFYNTNETIYTNETELVTIATNKTSNTLRASIKAVEANVFTTSKQLSSSNDIMPMQSSKTDKIDFSLDCLTTTASNAVSVSEKLQAIIEKLLQQNIKLELQLKCIKTSTEEELSKFLSDHQKFLLDIITEMRNFTPTSTETSSNTFPTSSTPNRFNFVKTFMGLNSFSAALNSQPNEHINISQQTQNTLRDNLTHSIAKFLVVTTKFQNWKIRLAKNTVGTAKYLLRADHKISSRKIT